MKRAKSIFLAGLALMLLAATGHAANKKLADYSAAYNKHVQKIEDEYKVGLQTALSKYGKSLNKALTIAKKAGDLEEYLALKKEKDSFVKEKSVPTESPAGIPKILMDIRANYQACTAKAKDGQNRNMASLIRRYISSLNARKRKYVQQDEIDQAIEVKSEIEKVEFILADLDSKMPKMEIKPKPVGSTPIQGKHRIPVSLEKRLVLHYSFDLDKGEKVIDLSGKGNHGEIVNARYAPLGKVGRACEFNGGTTRITIKDSQSLRVQQHTLSAWVKAAESMSGQLGIILSKEKSRAAGGYYLAYTHDKVNYKLMEGGRMARGYHNTLKTMELVPMQWYHLVGTFDGKTRRLYVNGKEVESVKEPMELFHDSTPITIGSGWNGLIDEIMIFDSSLTGEEVRQLYSARK